MKNTFTLLLFLGLFGSIGTLWGQTCADCRFISPVFDSVTVETVQFGRGENSEGQMQDLYLDFYQPYGDTAAIRPVVIFAFGGGFIQGARDEGYVINACKRFARAGYVSAAIDYRIGIDWTQFLNPVAEMQRVFFRAMQDMRASVQYMRYHADSLGNTWRLDTSQIIVGGASAGAITALMVQHCDSDSEYAEIGPLSSITDLGGFYSTSGLHPWYSWDAIGTVNIAGALVNADWVEPGDPPILSVHGDQDGTVPYEGGNLNLGIAQIGLEGSYLVDQEATAEGVCSYLYTIEGGDHPSGSISDAELDDIFNRLLPRMEALVYGRSYCCNLEATVDPSGLVAVTSGTSVPLASQVSGDLGNPTVEWCADPCGFHSTQDAVTVTANPGEHVILVVREGNCQTTDFVTFTAPVGISEPQPTPQENLQLFPNPASQQITLSWMDGNARPEAIEVLDATGKVVFQTESLPGHQLTMPVSRLRPGVYFVKVRQQGYWQVLTFTRQ